MHITLEPGPEAPVPLLAWLASAEAWLSSRGHRVNRTRSGDTRPVGPTVDIERTLSNLAIAVDGERCGQIALGWERGDVVAIRSDGEEARWPYALMRPAVSIPRGRVMMIRVLVAGLGGEEDRRSRMLLKVVEETRRRRESYLWLRYDPTVALQGTESVIDEQFVDLSAEEWYNLLSSVSLVLELGGSAESAAYESRAALSMGIPVVSHGAIVSGDPVPGVLTCDEWNADAFADTLSSTKLRERFEPAVDHDEIFSNTLRFFGIGN